MPCECGFGNVGEAATQVVARPAWVCSLGPASMPSFGDTAAHMLLGHGSNLPYIRHDRRLAPSELQHFAFLIAGPAKRIDDYANSVQALKPVAGVLEMTAAQRLDSVH